MKRIFVSYGDAKFENTLRRIGKEASGLGLFDEIRLYRPQDLPVAIAASPLMAFGKGGGYWNWKPFVIKRTLEDCSDKDLVCYADAGCVLRASEDWSLYFDKLRSTKAICFQYRSDFDYRWSENYPCNSPKIKHWSKRSTLEYFDRLLGPCGWWDFNKILGGVLFFRGKEGRLINDWLSLSLLKPELFYDPLVAERESQHTDFIEHRHDQSVLTPLAYYCRRIPGEVLIQPETCESNCEKSGVVAARRRHIEVPPFGRRARKFVFRKVRRLFESGFGS